MSTLETHMAGRRVAARNGDRRKKLILAGLLVLVAGLLAFQLPKLLKHSGSSSSTASPVTTTAPSAAPATGGRSTASAPTSAPANRDRAIRRMKARDPFVPVIRESAPASPSASTSHPASPPTRASAPAQQPTSHATPLTIFPIGPAPANPAGTGPAPVTPAEPTAAVIWTNGQRQVVGVAQKFDVGDATFKLAAVDRASMRLEVAAGSFTGGKGTITIRKGREVTLENDATGVRYTLRFAGGTTGAPTVQSTDGPEASADPSGGTSTSNGS